MKHSDGLSVEELIDEAEYLEWADPACLSLAEKAIRLADQLCDDSLRFMARAYSISYATSTGAIDKALVASAWCSSRPELLRDANEDTRRRFLWNLKLVLHSAHTLPHIQVEQIDDVLAQMSRYHQEYGYNRRPAEYLRFVNLMYRGDFDRASKSIENSLQSRETRWRTVRLARRRPESNFFHQRIETRKQSGWPSR